MNIPSLIKTAVRTITDRHGAIDSTDVTMGMVQPSSISISTNSKGVAQPEVKVYNTDPQVAAMEALAIYRSLTKELASDAHSVPGEGTGK